MLARLVGSGLRNLFFCESCDGSLQQVTEEMVRAMDLSVFSGSFRCCALGHTGGVLCDRERLRTPILGVYAQYLRKCMSDQELAADRTMTCVVQMDREKDLLLPRHFEFVQRCDEHHVTECIQSELFCPLPEILEHRIRVTRRQHATQDVCVSRAPAPEPAQNDLSTRSVVEGAGVASIHEEKDVGIESSGLAQGSALAERGGILDLDVPIHWESATGKGCNASALRGEKTPSEDF